MRDMTAELLPGWVPQDTLALRLKMLRDSLGLSQRQAAARAGITFGSWQSMEDGRAATNLVVKIRKIARTYGCSEGWLQHGGELSPDPAETVPTAAQRVPTEPKVASRARIRHLRLIRRRAA
jgi:transcriptional regulator with XRE-family HTH domain